MGMSWFGSTAWGSKVIFKLSTEGSISPITMAMSVAQKIKAKFASPLADTTGSQVLRNIHGTSFAIKGSEKILKIPAVRNQSSIDALDYAIENMPLLKANINKELSSYEQLAQAMKIHNDFVGASRLSIFDEDVVKQLNDRAPIINDIDELINFYRTDKAILKRQPDFKNWQGDKLHQEILDDLFKKDNIEFQLKYQKACFVAGTLVHTDKGLVPIQDIKVGDMVLSRDEFNPQGDLQYKPVLSTFKSQQKERIYKVEYPTNDGMEYIFCNALHPFWSAYDPSGKTGKWEAAEDLSGTFLVNLSGETFGLDNVPFMPVRTLPNYPEGCAYVQFVEDPDFWENGGGLIEFVKFDSNGYQFISLADNEEAFDEEIKTLNHKTLDAKLRLTPKANFLVDKELYKTLNVRLDQDIDADTHTAQKFIEAMNKPLIFEGRIVRENSIGNEELYRKALKNIEVPGIGLGK